MRKIIGRFSICTVLALVLVLAIISIGASGQNSQNTAMKRFFNQWKQAMAAGDEKEAQALVHNNRVIAEKVASAVGYEARKAFKTGDRDGAFALLTTTHRLFQQLDDRQGIATVSTDLGVFYHSVGDCRRALPLFGRALDINIELGQVRGKQAAMNGILACIPAFVMADPNLTTIATLKIAPDGTEAIVYNPKQCYVAGSAVCGFYLMHEYGHIHFKHARNNVPLAKSEPEADCWAAKNVSREWATAAYHWFMGGAPSPKVHGSSVIRAGRLRACAGF
jgi:hypothetical protein